MVSPADLKAKCVALQAECDRLEARVMLLEDALYGGDPHFPVEWELTKLETRWLATLYARSGVVTRDMLLTAIYQERSLPDLKILNVVACKVRRKVAPFGVEIETVWGRGYRLADPEKAKEAAFGADRARGETSLAWFSGTIGRNSLVKRMEAVDGTTHG